MPETALSVKDLTKDYITKSETVRALRGVSFDVPEGDFITVSEESDVARCAVQAGMITAVDRAVAADLIEIDIENHMAVERDLDGERFHGGLSARPYEGGWRHAPARRALV